MMTFDEKDIIQKAFKEGSEAILDAFRSVFDAMVHDGRFQNKLLA